MKSLPDFNKCLKKGKGDLENKNKEKWWIVFLWVIQKHKVVYNSCIVSATRVTAERVGNPEGKSVVTSEDD